VIYTVCEGVKVPFLEFKFLEVPFMRKSGKSCYLFTYKITYLATKICIYK